MTLFDSRIKTKEDDLVAYKTVEINPTNKMTMETLPIEVLTHILQYLSPIDRLRSEQVCKIWRDASRHTWRDVQTLYIIDPTNSNEYYCRFKNCTEPHEFVEKEDNRLFIASDYLEIIRCLVSRVGRFIKELIYDHCWIEAHRAILPVVNSYCHNLKIFDIGLLGNGYNEELFSRLFQLNKELHSLKCYKNDLIEALPLRDWRSLRFVAFNTMHENKTISMIEHSEALEEFEISHFTRRIAEVLLTRRKLKSLYFNTLYGASLEMIFDVPLLNRLTNLNIVSFDHDSHLLCNILQHCCQLKRLCITDYRSSVSVNLLETILALPVLETLGLCYFSITDHTLIHLIKVRNLLIDRTGDFITNNGILQMIKKSEVLEKLDIKDTDVTPEMFKQLVGEMSDRPKYLEVVVPYEIRDEISEICAGSKIRVVREMQCFRY